MPNNGLLPYCSPAREGDAGSQTKRPDVNSPLLPSSPCARVFSRPALRCACRRSPRSRPLTRDAGASNQRTCGNDRLRRGAPYRPFAVQCRSSFKQRVKPSRLRSPPAIQSPQGFTLPRSLYTCRAVISAANELPFTLRVVHLSLLKQLLPWCVINAVR